MACVEYRHLVNISVQFLCYRPIIDSGFGSCLRPDERNDNTTSTAAPPQYIPVLIVYNVVISLTLNLESAYPFNLDKLS